MSYSDILQQQPTLKQACVKTARLSVQGNHRESLKVTLSSLVSLYVQTSALFYLFIVFLLVKTQHVLISRLFKKAK